MSSGLGVAPTRESTRTRVACKNCNARRIRCHRPVSEQACTNCQLLKVDCQLIESKRGKYKRTSSRPQLNQRARRGCQASGPPESLPAANSVPSAETPDEDEPVHYASPSLPDIVIDQGDAERHRVIYMGDCNNMKYLIHKVGDPFKDLGRKRLWGDYLQQSATARLTSATRAKLAELRDADDEHLRSLGAFDSPEPGLGEKLHEVFFEQVYPFFPVLDESDFRIAQRNGQNSPLLLNALYLVACIHCPAELIAALGYDSRYLACSTFYQRAKALHEKSYETDAITSIQACLLLTNWWQEPMDQRDTWYWLGVAAHTAQALGMHRAKSYQILSRNRQRLWRRIWWTLFAHDVHHAAVFGRPPHIHRQYSDVTPLSVDDMLSSQASVTAASDEAGLFAPEFCRLAILLDQCLQEKSSMTDRRHSVSQSWLALESFPAALPSLYKGFNGTVTGTDGFYPAVLRLIYLDYLIVVERMLSPGRASGVLSTPGPYFSSAGAICRVLEDLLASPSQLVTRLPYVTFPAIYCSISIHIMNLRREPKSVRLVAEHRARFGMMVSDQLQDRWPFAVWTHYLLDRMLKNTESSVPLATDSGSRSEQQHSSETVHHPSAAGGTVQAPTPRTEPADVAVLSKGSGMTSALPHAIYDMQGANVEASSLSGGLFSPLPSIFLWDTLIDDGMDVDQWLL